MQRTSFPTPERLLRRGHEYFPIVLHLWHFLVASDSPHKPINFQKISDISKEGVLCLLSDSTNAELEGHTASEKKVADSIKAMFKNIDGRIPN